MKNLDLNAYGVKEMNRQELENVEGGNIFQAIFDAIVEGIVWIYENILNKPPVMPLDD